jgi:hypothetical protein
MGVLTKLGMFALVMLVVGHAKADHGWITWLWIIATMVYFHIACSRAWYDGEANEGY